MNPEGITPNPLPPASGEEPPLAARRRPVVVGIVSLILLAALAGAGWWWWHLPRPAGPAPDMDAVLELNNRGVGLMEQFKYADKDDPVVPVFEEVVRRAPDWVPGRVNLGIALFNRSGKAEDGKAGDLERAITVFEDVLRREPENPFGHYCLGIIYHYQSKVAQAAREFEAVTRIDPADPCAWYYLGSSIKDTEPERATRCFRRAVDLNPHFNSALYSLVEQYRGTDPDRADALLDTFSALKNPNIQWENLVSSKYTYSEVGRYAQVISPIRALEPQPQSGPLPLFQRQDAFAVKLAAGARWARAADFGKGAVAEVRTWVRVSFGGTIVVLDYDRDGKPDLFLAGAVVEKGHVRDLLLRNEGGGHFTDVTAAAGLAAPHPTLGCCVADYDNDGYPDLFLTGCDSQRLFRNTGKGGFEDVTVRAGLDGLTAVCLGAAFVDLDQDGDLDLLVSGYAAAPADVFTTPKGGKAPAGAGLAVYLNVGKAPPHRPTDNQPPLDTRFRRDEQVHGLAEKKGPVMSVAVSDLDGDRDPDVVLLADRAAPAVALNDRLLRFRRQEWGGDLAPPGIWNGALVLDANHDGRSDLLLVAGNERPRLLLNHSTLTEPNSGKWFQAGATNSPPLIQAHAVDLDLDSWTDVVGLSVEHLPVLLHNEGGGRLVCYHEALGLKASWPKDLVGLALFPSQSGHKDGDRNGPHCGGVPDLLVWSESQGLLLHANRGNGHHGIQLELKGQIKTEPWDTTDRCNADGIGARVAVQAGGLWAGQENTTLSAALGQSRQPLLLGLGPHPRADVVRIEWPDGVLQAELEWPCGKGRPLIEVNRKTGSCPVLFAWDGSRFRFVTDFLGAGSLGELGPDRRTRPPRPEESVKIEPGQLVARGGAYVLKVAEPMDEITYLDHAELVVIDHPAGVRVYPDERFAPAGPPPSQDLIAFREEVFPVRARDHRGRDVTDRLRRRDRATADGFAKRAWRGFAEEHCVELDFAGRLVRYGPGERLYLCLAGWTDYAYPESIWAAHQAGVEMQPPLLERQEEDGAWQVVAEAGFPAGLPRMMLLDVTGKLGGSRCRLRLRTNLHVYWDQVFVAAGCQTVRVGAAGTRGLLRAVRLPVAAARLSPCGIMREYSADGRQPTLYDHDRYDAVPVRRPAGKLTRYGDVTELLGRRDDCFAIFGPGDELTVRFDARGLPPLPGSWVRSFVLRSAGYCKDTGPFTATGATVEPLPFRAMSAYPYGPGEHYPDDPAHRAYRRRYNTRVATPEVFPGRRRGG